MPENGEIEGLLIGIALCFLFVLFAVFETKKERKKTNEIKEQISKENIEKLKSTQFELYESNNNFLINTSYIYEITEKDGRVAIKLFFYQGEFATKNESEFIRDTVYMSKEDFEKKKLKVGQFVQTLHNRINQVKFKVSKIL